MSQVFELGLTFLSKNEKCYSAFNFYMLYINKKGLFILTKGNPHG